MKKALLKDSVKEIIKTYKRFISILLMAFLGVGFFSGIRVASPDMVDTIDKYYDEQQVYDIQILSTLGLTENDLKSLSEIDGVDKVEGSYESDGKIEIDNKETIVKLLVIGELNKPLLLEGNMPTNINECLVEQDFLNESNKKIGDKILVEVEQTTNDNGDKIEYLKEKEMTIVGTVQSPLYISRDRGNSELGAGKVNYYMYIAEENINAKDVYTQIYIKVKNAEEYTTSSDKYEDYIEEIKQNIEQIKTEREQARKEELVNIANEKLQEAENELNTQKQEAETKISEAEQELADARKEIEDGENEIKTNREQANKKFADAEKEIENGKIQLQQNEQELNSKEQEANKNFEQLEAQKQELQSNLTQIKTTLTELESQYNLIIEKLKDETLSETEKVQYEQQKAYLETQIQTMNQTKQTLESNITQIETGIQTGKTEIQNARNQIEQAKIELQNNEEILKKTKASTYAELESAEEKIEEAKQEVQEGEEELNKNKLEFEQKIADAEKELLDAKEKVNDIENPEWYILDRNSNAGYVGFIQDTESIKNVGRVFPVVFFVVAALISLTSMTRMVEEQRLQIGTLKALGYNKIHIISKYILYATLASVIGGITGMCVGFVSLPPMVWMMYSVMYQISEKISLKFDFEIGGIGLILICVCIIGATIYSTIKELKETPAILMRPKAPKMGNRVLLEKIPFIWKKLNFSQKVTVRNIFRYKKRFFMTIIGISGCTALILTGFGLKDSIKVILPNQYEKVFNYDLQISLRDELYEEEKQKYILELQEKEEIEKISETYMTSSDAIKGDLKEEVQIIVPKETLEGVINVIDKNTNEEVELKENEICLTDKAAQLLEVKSGDTIKLKDSNNNEYEVKISNIVENYVSHYVYMSKTMYENLYGETYSTNVIITKNKDITEEQEEDLVAQLMEDNEVSSITRTSTIMSTLDDTLVSLNYVMLILIVSAGLLAFVVLYNLANINISERIRELATIKVLGFYDREVYNYVTRETILLTIIGMAIGLFGGYFLNFFIIGTCEINMLRFSKIIYPISYIYAILITILFTIIVNIATYFALKKINMIESLKSVE